MYENWNFPTVFIGNLLRYTRTALRRVGLNMDKCMKTGISRPFLLGTFYVTRKGVSIYGLVYIRLYYGPIRHKKKMEMLHNF